jgi:uncharacterized protein YqhQ
MSGNSFPNGMVLLDLRNNMACISCIDKEKVDTCLDIDLTNKQDERKRKRRIGMIGALYQIVSYLVDTDNIDLLDITSMLWQGIYFIYVVMAFIFLPLIFGAGWLWQLIGGGIYFISLFLVYSLTFFIPSQNIRKFHGAEHKIINCHDSGLPLNVENIQAQSRKNKYCGIGIVVYGWFMLLILYICVPFVNPVIRLCFFAVVALVAFLFGNLVFRWANKKISPLRKIALIPSLWIQNITTGEPTNEQILIGLQAAERLLMNQVGFTEIEEGYFAGDLFTGKSKAIYQNGNSYDGVWLNGRITGYGVYRFNGNVYTEYTGYFAGSRLQGKGKMLYANGDSYEGDWKNTAMSGYGIYRYSYGDEYIGGFKNGKFHGKGQLIFTNGNSFDGEWRNNQIYHGIYYFTNGEEYHV